MQDIGKYAERSQLAPSVCPGQTAAACRSRLGASAIVSSPVPAHFLATACVGVLLAALLALTAATARAEAPAAAETTAAETFAGTDPVPRRAHPSYSLDDAQRARVARLVDEISDLDASQLDTAAQQTVGAAEADLVLAVLLRAGRPTPPGLSTARRAQRDLRSQEALSWLRAALAQPARAALVSSAVSSALDVSSPAPELSVAAMRVVAQLDLVEHTGEVARWLNIDAAEASDAGDAGVTARRIEAERMGLSARSALFQLYGRWFEDADAFARQWGLLSGRPPQATGRDELLDAIRTSNAHALKLIEFAPSRLGHGPLEWSRPQMRAEAARAVGRAVAAGTMLPDVAREALVGGLKDERSEDALAARLRTLIDLVQGADPSGEAATEVRALVFELAELAKSRSCDEIWVMIGSLAQLGNPYGLEGDEPRAATVGLAVELFGRALARGEVMALDPDALQSAMTSISGVVRSIQDDAFATEVARPFSELVRPMVVGERGAARRAAIPLRVRRAAADAFALSVKPSDALDLVALVRSMDTPELEYELLGALRAVISVLEPGSEEAEAVIFELFETVADSNFDSRSRALELLLSEDVRPALSSVERETESRWVEARVLAEPAPELQVRLARLLSLVGKEDSLERMLAPDPAPLAKLAAINEDLIAAAAELASALSASSPSLRIRAALCIAGPNYLLAEPQGDPSTLALQARRPMRVRAGFDLMLTVDFADTAAISAEERAAALAWIFPAAVELRQAQPVQVGALFSGSSQEALALKALIALDPASAVQAPEGAPRAAEFVQALMTSDQMRAAAGLGLKPANEEFEARKLNRVMETFNRVITHVAQEGPFHGWTRPNLLMEGVKLLLAIDETEGAVRRLERLLDPVDPMDAASEEPTVPGTKPAMPAAAPSIIRLYADLILAAEPFSGQSELRASLAAFHLSGLVQRPTWSTEPADARLLDLEMALQISTMLGPDDVQGPALISAVAAAAAAPGLKDELKAVDADRAASVWRQLEVQAEDD